MCTKLCCKGVNQNEAKHRTKRKRKAKIIKSFRGSWFNKSSKLDIRRDNHAPIGQRWRVTGIVRDHFATFQPVGFVQSLPDKIKFTWQALLSDGKEIIKYQPERVIIINPPAHSTAAWDLRRISFDLPILRAAMNPSLIRELVLMFPDDCHFYE